MAKQLIWIYDDVFEQNYYFINVDTYKELVKICDKKLDFKLVYDFDDQEPPGTISGCYIVDEEGNYIIWVPNALNNPDILAHEVCHTINKFCKTRGITTKSGQDETFCYLVQFLMKKILSKLKG